MTHSDLLTNPFTAAVANLDQTIATITEPTTLDHLEELGTLDTNDWLDFGDKASRALMAGIIDQNTAQSLYAVHSGWSSATLAQRVCYIMMMAEILPLLRAKGF